MWQASAERILLAMTYGEFGSVVATQDNRHLLDLLNHNVVIEMDGLSSSSDRTMFSEALTLYLYRYRLAQGSKPELTNVIILEEAHNLLHQKQAGARESVLETSIRMIRQYGLGYVFVDQSASLISKVAFANSYATLALSQKLRADVQAMAGAMNLTDEQREALSTLPIGSAVVRLADEHPEPFLVKIPRCSIREGGTSDSEIQRRMAAYYSDSRNHKTTEKEPGDVSPVPPPDNNENKIRESLESHPPSPKESGHSSGTPVPPDTSTCDYEAMPPPPPQPVSRDATRFLFDVASRPLSTTVSRYQRLHLSRRRGNAVRHDLAAAGLIEPVPLATRTGQVVLYQLTEQGRSVCTTLGIDPGAPPRASLEHSYWAKHAAMQFEKHGYDVAFEHPIPGDGFVDVVAERPGERVAIEIETGKSDIKANVAKLRGAGFDRIVVIATSPSATAACHRAFSRLDSDRLELKTWLDLG